MTIETIMNPPQTPTREQVRAALQMTIAVAEAIRGAKQIPSGVLYATLQGKLDFEGYQKLIGMLKRTQLVEERNHLLTWIGPDPGEVAK